MLRIAEEAAQLLESEHPQVADCLGGLTAAGVRHAIIGSQAAHMASLMLDIPGLATPDDWDLQIAYDDFERAVAYTKADVQWTKLFKITTGDGREMRFVADDARARIGSDTIQFMRLHTPAFVDGHPIYTRFSREACAAAKRYGNLTFAHDTESIMLYGLRQGGDDLGKQDLLRAAAIRATRPR